ncbi:MAG: PASTA domain-containing protein [Verrucomicrobiaceae bacterium]
MKRRLTPFFVIGILWMAQMVPVFAALDDFQQALNEAKERVFRYRAATNTNDAKATRDAMLRLQEDPLAMRQVSSSAESFKTGISKDIAALQDEVKSLILTHLEESGIKRERVSFLDVIQPPWDMGFRIDLRVVPTRISQPFAREAYYELATGQTPPPTSDKAARAEYVEAAGKYGEQLMLAWAGAAYDEQQTEDSLVLAGVRDARLRDPGQRMEFASADARQLAADLQGEGKLAPGVDRDIEELRQSMRQFDTQVRPQLEAAGEQVPKEIADAREIVRQVDAGTVTPAQARDRIIAMGQTPAAINRRTTQWVDVVQALLPLVVLRPAVGAAPAPVFVFNGNVNRQLANRRLVRIIQWVDTGLLTLAQARAQITQMNVGAVAAAPPAQNGAIPRQPLVALLRAADAGQNTTPPLPAGTPGDPQQLRVAGVALADATLLPVRAGERGNATDAGDANKTRQRDAAPANTLSDAIRRRSQSPDAWSLASQTSQTEAADEEARAAAEKRVPVYSRSVLNAALIGPAEELMLNAVARADAAPKQENRITLGPREELILSWVRSKLVENIKTIAGLTRDLQWYTWRAEVGQPDFTRTFAALTGHYNNARLAMADLADRAGQRLGDKDPLVLALRKKVSRLADPPKAADVIKVRETELAATPAGESAKKPNTDRPTVATSQTSSSQPVPTPPAMKSPPPVPVKATIKVPDLTKLTKADAEKKISELKLKLVASAGSDKPPRTAKKGEVYRQSPSAGSVVVEGDTIKLDYYTGFPVGKYVGLNKAEAEAAIQRDGLIAKVSEGDSGKTAAEGLQVYQQQPPPGSQAWFDDQVVIVYHKPMASGFQDGDGAKIDPRVAAAAVHDGGAAEVACYKGASGSHGVLATPMPKNPGPNSSFNTFALLHFDDAAGAQAFYNETAGPMTANQNIPGHKESITRIDGGVAYTRNMNLGGYKLTNHIRIVIYRGNFVIMYSMQEPNSAADVSHGAGIVERSKALIDLRFPAK